MHPAESCCVTLAFGRRVAVEAFPCSAFVDQANMHIAVPQGLNRKLTFLDFLHRDYFTTCFTLRNELFSFVFPPANRPFRSSTRLKGRHGRSLQDPNHQERLFPAP
jgi:hypothetical protein